MPPVGHGPRRSCAGGSFSCWLSSSNRPRESEAIDKQLFHLQAKRFETPEAAQAELATLEKAWTYHQVEAYRLIEHQRYAGKGMPTPITPIKSSDWQIEAQGRTEQAKLEDHRQCIACFVGGTNIEAEQLSDPEVIVAYKGQSQAEGAFGSSKIHCSLSRRYL